MTRVAVFIDGKYFHVGWKEFAESQQLDFQAMARFLLGAVNGKELFGAFYYTGVESGENRNQGLDSFLSNLKKYEGYFVKVFERKPNQCTCEHCGGKTHYTVEKEVDTTLVADMIRFAASDAYDVAILISGDSDFTPGIAAVQELGKRAYLASWNGRGLSNRLREAAFHHIDLADHFPKFLRSTTGGTPQYDWSEDDSNHSSDTSEPAPDPNNFTEDDVSRSLLALFDAEQRFKPNGFVGQSMFVSKWKSPFFPHTSLYEKRRLIVEAAIDEGLVERYEAFNEQKDTVAWAIRLTDAGNQEVEEQKNEMTHLDATGGR